MRQALAKAMLVLLLVSVAAATSPVVLAQPARGAVVHHDLTVALDPANHRLKVRDRIRIPGALVTAPLTLSLNADLAVQASSAG